MIHSVAIRVEQLSKEYRLYKNKRDRLRESLSITNKRYSKSFYALKDVSFEVNRGETVGIIGTNGSGKSTLLKILTGVIAPTTGTAHINGKISALLELGAGFNPEYTGIENIYLNGLMMGYSRDEVNQKIQNIIDFAEIGEYVYQPVKTYSSGMFARLAFAVAINVEPDILIVDEALSVGDVFFQNKCFRKFEELKDNGVTILFVSHDIESVKQMCNRVVWIEKGIQMMFGPSKEVCNAYSKSILLKNNGDVSNRILDNDTYSKKSFQLTDYPFITYSAESLKHKDVKILSCFFQNREGHAVYDICGGEKCIFSVIFQSKIEIKQCIVGFVIQNKKGVSLINTNSLITGEERNFSVDANTINKVDFEFVFPLLAEDEYVVDCAVADGISVMDNTMLTWVYGAVKIVVEESNPVLATVGVDAKVSIYSNEQN